MSFLFFFIYGIISFVFLCSNKVMKSTNNDVIDAYKTNWAGVRYCKVYLNAVATVDQRKTEISAYLYAKESDFIIKLLSKFGKLYHKII